LEGMRQEQRSFSDCRLQMGPAEVPGRRYAKYLPTLASRSGAHHDGLRTLPHAGDADLPADHHGAVSQAARSLTAGELVRYTGTRTVARSPPSGLSDSVISPPCERAMSRAMARPRPVPPSSWLRA